MRLLPFGSRIFFDSPKLDPLLRHISIIGLQLNFKQLIERQTMKLTEQIKPMFNYYSSRKELTFPKSARFTRSYNTSKLNKRKLNKKMKPITKNEFEVLVSLKNQLKNKSLTDNEKLDLLELIEFQTKKIVNCNDKVFNSVQTILDELVA